MNRRETGIIMDILQTAYPQYYRDISVEESKNAISLWSEMFADDPVAIVAAAVKDFIAKDDKGFAPNIGMIKTRVDRCKGPALPEGRNLDDFYKMREELQKKYHSKGLMTASEAVKTGIAWKDWMRMCEEKGV